MQATRSHRGLSTARAALQCHVAARPRARRRPRRRGGARRSARASRPPTTCSPACATRASPSATPGGLYHLAPGFRETVAEESDRHDLSGVVDDLLARTHKRAYLAVLRGNQLRVVARARPAGHAEAARA